MLWGTLAFLLNYVPNIGSIIAALPAVLLALVQLGVGSALLTALFAGLLWELAKHLFVWYVAHLAGYSIFYGSLSTVVIFVLWVYYSAAILVVAAEFAYFLEKDRQESMPCQGQARKHYIIFR